MGREQSKANKKDREKRREEKKEEIKRSWGGSVNKEKTVKGERRTE